MQTTPPQYVTDKFIHTLCNMFKFRYYSREQQQKRDNFKNLTTR
jgi:hypothetical protein